MIFHSSGLFWLKPSQSLRHQLSPDRACSFFTRNCFEFLWDDWQNNGRSHHTESIRVRINRLFSGIERIPNDLKPICCEFNRILNELNCTPNDRKRIPRSSLAR